MEEKIKCPLVNKMIKPVDCLENQSLKDESIPKEFKVKENWKDICKNCPYQDY